MTKFYLWLKQTGEGCDYTIGCGERLIPLNAHTIEDARKEALERADFYGLFGEDVEAKHGVIYEFKENVTHLIAAERKRRFEEDRDEVKEARIKELETELQTLKKPRGR